MVARLLKSETVCIHLQKKLMLVRINTSLKKYNTFGIESYAKCVIHIRTEKEAKSVFNQGLSWKKPLLILGAGSNLLFTSDFKGTIIRPEFSGIRIEKQAY